MLISELAQKTGLTSHTIRFYEKRGLLANRYIQRGTNNYRQYSKEAIERITMITTLHAAGFTLSEIKDIMDKWDAGKLTPQDGELFLQQKMDEIDARIAELMQCKVTLLNTLGCISIKLSKVISITLSATRLKKLRKRGHEAWVFLVINLLPYGLLT